DEKLVTKKHSDGKLISKCKNVQRILITFDNGRLSKEEIEHMVADAEKYRAENEKVAQRIQARNF
ncbi:9505_t:CDS:2, partial [Gigaspora rosea]